MGCRRAEVSGGNGSRRHPEDPGPSVQASLDVAAGLADEHGVGAVVGGLPAQPRPGLGDGHEPWAIDVVAPEGPGVEVDEAVQPDGAQLGLGVGPDVARQHGLQDARFACKGGERFGGPGQRPAVAAVVLALAGDGSDEGRADPFVGGKLSDHARQQLVHDRQFCPALGFDRVPARLAGEGLHRLRVHVVRPRAHPEQGVVDVPEDQDGRGPHRDIACSTSLRPTSTKESITKSASL